MTLADRNPVLIRGAAVAAVTAVIHVLVVMGLVAENVEDPIAAAVDAVGLLALLVWARAGVTPNAKVITRVTTDGAVIAGNAALIPTGRELEVEEGTFPVVQAVAVNPALVEDAPKHRAEPLPEGTHVRHTTELVHGDDDGLGH